MLIEVTAPVGVLGLVDGQSLPGETRFEFERTASVLGCGSPSLVVSGDDARAVVRRLRRRPTVEDITVNSDVGDEIVCRLTWGETVPDLLECVRENDGTILSAIAQKGVWTFKLRFVGAEAASRFYARYDDAAYPLTIRRMSVGGTTAHQDRGERLTTEQRDALVRAVEEGYFEVPRQVTLTELGRELDISDTAVSQRLRRGLSKVLRDPADAASETGEAGRREG